MLLNFISQETFNTEIGNVDKFCKNNYCTRHLIGLLTNIHLSGTVHVTC